MARLKRSVSLVLQTLVTQSGSLGRDAMARLKRRTGANIGGRNFHGSLGRDAMARLKLQHTEEKRNHVSGSWITRPRRDGAIETLKRAKLQHNFCQPLDHSAETRWRD